MSTRGTATRQSSRLLFANNTKYGRSDYRFDEHDSPKFSQWPETKRKRSYMSCHFFQERHSNINTITQPYSPEGSKQPHHCIRQLLRGTAQLNSIINTKPLRKGYNLLTIHIPRILREQETSSSIISKIGHILTGPERTPTHICHKMHGMSNLSGNHHVKSILPRRLRGTCLRL